MCSDLIKYLFVVWVFIFFNLQEREGEKRVNGFMKKMKSGNLKRKKQKIKKVWENCVIRLNDGFFIIEKCVDVRKYVGIAGYSASLRNDSLKSWFHRKYCKIQIVIKIKTTKYNQETSTLLLWNISFPHKAHSPYCYYFTEKIPQWPPKATFFLCVRKIY